jgi:ribosomal protein S18 acetylase RimI-like enzyme
MTAAGLQLQLRETGGGAVCRDILATLPTWFGLPDSVAGYVALAERTPTLVAGLGGEDAGFVTVVRHGPQSAEVAVMGVRPDHHRHGIGRALLQRAESDLARDGVEFLQVKTLSSRHPDEGYARTRAFYLAYGFVVLEEFPHLWSDDQPAVLLIKTVPPRRGNA